MYGKKVRYLRETSGMSQQQLADKIGIVRTCLSLIENDKRKMKAEELREIAKFFGVPISAFYDQQEGLSPNAWKPYGHFSAPIDDKNYLVRWINAEGKASCPMLAYWIAEEKAFFPLHLCSSFPLRVDEYKEID